MVCVSLSPSHEDVISMHLDLSEGGVVILQCTSVKVSKVWPLFLSVKVKMCLPWLILWGARQLYLPHPFFSNRSASFTRMVWLMYCIVLHQASLGVKHFIKLYLRQIYDTLWAASYRKTHSYIPSLIIYTAKKVFHIVKCSREQSGSKWSVKRIFTQSSRTAKI